jgi:hypothetical protein
MLASRTDANTPDRQDALAADRDVSGTPYRRRVPAPVVLVPGSRRGTEYPLHGLTNANAMLHVANGVANARRIEIGDGYKFYAEGVTPAVARLYETINAERVAVAAALGASVPTLADWFDRVYGVRKATLVKTCQRLTFNSDGALSGDRNAEVARSQVHHRRRADRPHSYERAGRSGRGEDARD